MYLDLHLQLLLEYACTKNALITGRHHRHPGFQNAGWFTFFTPLNINARRIVSVKIPYMFNQILMRNDPDGARVKPFIMRYSHEI